MEDSYSLGDKVLAYCNNWGWWPGKVMEVDDTYDVTHYLTYIYGRSRKNEYEEVFVPARMLQHFDECQPKEYYLNERKKSGYCNYFGCCREDYARAVKEALAAQCPFRHVKPPRPGIYAQSKGVTVRIDGVLLERFEIEKIYAARLKRGSLQYLSKFCLKWQNPEDFEYGYEKIKEFGVRLGLQLPASASKHEFDKEIHAYLKRLGSPYVKLKRFDEVQKKSSLNAGGALIELNLEESHHTADDQEQAEQENDEIGSVSEFSDGWASLVSSKTTSSTTSGEGRNRVKCPDCEKTFGRNWSRLVHKAYEHQELYPGLIAEVKNRKTRYKERKNSPSNRKEDTNKRQGNPEVADPKKAKIIKNMYCRKP